MSEWISVEERLPEDYEVVIVCHSVAGKGVLCPTGTYVWFAKRCDGIWKRSDNLSSDEIFHGDVTHWMPLPAPPKAKP